MDNTYFLLILLSSTFILLMLILDHWSTKTILKYKRKLIENDKILKLSVENDKKKGVERYELNPIGRYFFKKYGVDKGITFFRILIVIPFFLILFLGMIFLVIHPFAILFAFFFYFGAIFSQIRRALFFKKELKNMEDEINYA